MSRQSGSTPRSNRKTIVIGFDFGTHSTKVVVRERRKQNGVIVKFDRAARGYTPLTSPSLVRCVEEQLYFGTTALSKSGGQLHKSPKVSLLLQNGRAAKDGSDSPEMKLLVAAYFAWAFQQLRRKLKEYSDANVFLNVAAPMNHFEDPALKDKYLHIIQAAWQVSFAEKTIPIRQGIAIREAANILTPLLDLPVTSAEERRFDVLPETMAPIVSLSLDPWMEPGMYVIIDTGAGTTEMSVFHAGETGADQKVLCYSDETMLLGGNDLHLAERSADADGRVALNKIIDVLTKQYRRVWHQGYQLDSANPQSRQRWKQLTLVLSGGGTRHSLVSGHLSETNPMTPWGRADTVLHACRHTPGTLEMSDELDDESASMFAVANGLAVERPRWPLVFAPGQIPPLDPPDEKDEKPDAYWYL